MNVSYIEKSFLKNGYYKFEIEKKKIRFSKKLFN